MRPAETIGKLRSLVAELGPLDAALYLVNRVVNRTCPRFSIHRYYFMAQPIRQDASGFGRLGRSITVRRVERADPALSQMPLTPEVLAYRFSQGAICFGAFKGARMIGCAWYVLGAYIEDEVRCRFVPQPPGMAAWDFGVFIAPEHRVGLAFARLWQDAGDALTGLGIRWSVSRISAFNARSHAAHRRLGARRIGSAVFCRIGRLQVTVSTVRPRIHLSLSPGCAPVFELGPPTSWTAGPPEDALRSRRARQTTSPC